MRKIDGNALIFNLTAQARVNALCIASSECVMEFGGNVDKFGYSPTLGGVLMVGWIDLNWTEAVDKYPATIIGEAGATGGIVTLCIFPREDVRKRGHGVVLLAKIDVWQIGSIQSLKIDADIHSFKLERSAGCQEYSEQHIFQQAKQSLDHSHPSSARTSFRHLLERPHYKEENSLINVNPHVHFEIDTMYFCPPRGFVLVGWFLDPFEDVAGIRINCGISSYPLNPSTWISLQRPDVVQGFSTKYALSHNGVGFIAYVPDILQSPHSLHVEIEMRDGRVAFRPLPPTFFTGLPAIKELLSRFQPRSDELSSVFDNVVGPAVAAMNAYRLGKPPEEKILRYGVPIDVPQSTIIVPLYGRVDFLEYQLAFFSQGLHSDHEIIYVLDDPERRAEAEALAASCWAKFERPFTLIVLTHNVGYAPANNIGLRHARGDYVCFLNSDVFPSHPDWIDLLISTEKSDETLGVVGALLTYEDETVQHRGCTFEPIPELGNWRFVNHPDKGRRPAFSSPRGDATAITGACMLMKRELALLLDGFDDEYVIGDFEDADLCLRARDLGLTCAVDYRARLYHLERQSQGQTQPWRSNLTLYNAWQFQKRWRNHELREV